VAARDLKIAIGALAMVLILISVWAAFRHHAGSAVRAPTNSRGLDQAWDGGAKPMAAAGTATKVSSLWVRPSAEVAARNYRRQGFAWILRQLGASEEQLNRLTDQDLLAVFSELKRKAQSGDPAAINILGEIALQNCRLGRDDATLEAFAASQITEAQALPPKDAAWFTAAMHEDIAFDKRVNAACKQVIDQDEILSWVTARAAQGDGASMWLLFRAADNMTDMQRRLRDAAAAGFPQAQFELAWAIIGGQQGAAGTGSAKVNAGDLLRQSADQLPRSEGELAVCEYSGCDGVDVDVDAAIEHAREAAQRGEIDAMLAMGPHLPAGLVNPDEVMAWGLVHASLLQRGCEGNGFSVRETKGTLSSLNANNITPQARTLAEQYWSDYGAQITANIGCSS
jgi:TPR repeat protein